MTKFHDTVVVTGHSPIQRKSVEQQFSRQVALSNHRTNPPVKPRTPPSITSWEVVRAPPPPGSLTTLDARRSTLNRPKPRTYAEGSRNQSPPRTSSPTGPNLHSPPRPSSPQASEPHSSEKLLAAAAAPSDVSVGSGVLGRNLPAASLLYDGGNLPHSPLDMPMLWPQPPLGLSDAPTAIPPPHPIVAGRAEAGISGVSSSGNPFSPTVRSYVTFGGGRFASRQLAAFSSVRQRDTGMRAMPPTRVVRPGDALGEEGGAVAPNDAAGPSLNPLSGSAGVSKKRSERGGSAAAGGRAGEWQGPQWLLEPSPFEPASSLLEQSDGHMREGHMREGHMREGHMRDPSRSSRPSTSHGMGHAHTHAHTHAHAHAHTHAHEHAHGTGHGHTGALKVNAFASYHVHAKGSPRDALARGPGARHSAPPSAKHQRPPLAPAAAGGEEAWWLLQREPLRGYGAPRVGERQLTPLRANTFSRPSSSGFT